MDDEAAKDAACRVADRAMNAIGQQLTPLIDGKVVVGMEVIVLIRSGAVLAPSRMTLARTESDQAAVRLWANRIHDGSAGEPRETADAVYPAPRRN